MALTLRSIARRPVENIHFMVVFAVLKCGLRSGMVVHTCNTSTWEVDAGDPPLVQGQPDYLVRSRQPELHGATLSHTRKERPGLHILDQQLMSWCQA